MKSPCAARKTNAAKKLNKQVKKIKSFAKVQDASVIRKIDFGGEKNY